MIEISLGLIVSAFIAGILMFLAPCTLPLVPAYVAFISGVNTTKGNTSENQTKKIKTNALAFVFGFSLIFIIFGMFASVLSLYFGNFRMVLTQAGGLLVIFFGLLMLGAFKVPTFAKEYHLRIPESIKPGKPQSAFLIGIIFALGWTPCVGPILASVLLLASTSSTAFSGAFLLLIFSLGMAIPFLLVAFFFEKASHYTEKYSYISKYIQFIGAVFLLLVGALLLTGNFGVTTEYGYRLFDFLHYEALLNYL